MYHQHHAVHHAIAHFIPSFGTSLIPWLAHGAVSEVFTLVPFLPWAAVAIAIGGCAGPLAWGATKASIGWIQRHNPFSRAAEDFRAEQRDSTDLQNAISDCIDNALKDSNHLELSLAKFYQRNEIMREPVGALAWGLCSTDRERALALKRTSAELGTHEETEIWKAQLLHENLVTIGENDIRSPALLKSVGESKPFHLSSLLTPKALLKSIFRRFLNLGIEISTTAHTAGTDGAILASREFDAYCLSKKNSIASPFFGLGHASASALTKITESSDLQEALMGSAEGLVNLANLQKEWLEGPSLQDLVVEGFAIEKLLADKGEIKPLTWRERLWQLYTKWSFLAGASVVNTAVFAVKKPVIANALIQKQATSGNPTPGQIEKALAQKKGRFPLFLAQWKEIRTIANHAFIGIVDRIPNEFRLKLGATLHRSGHILKGLFPKDSAALLRASYEHRLKSKQEDILRVEAKLLENAKTLSDLPVDRLKNICQKAKFQFLRADRATHSAEALNELYEQAHKLAEYWEVRNAEHWLKSKIRSLDHTDTLNSIDLRLEALRGVSRPSPKKQARWVRKLGKQYSKTDTPDSKWWSTTKQFAKFALIVVSGTRPGESKATPAKQPELTVDENGEFVFPTWPKLAEFIENFNQKPLQTNPYGSRQVLDIGPSDELIVLEPNGTLSLISQEDAWLQTVEHWSTPKDQPLFHFINTADKARHVFASTVLSRIEPNQRQALLLAHHDAITGTRDLTAQVRDLLANDFSMRQLFGVYA